MRVRSTAAIGRTRGAAAGSAGPGARLLRAGQAVGRHAPFGRDLTQQADQLRALGLGERGAEASLVHGHYLLGLPQRVPAAVGQVERVRAPVGRVTPPLDQPALFELVHQEDHARGVEAHQLSERLLRRALVGSEPHEQAGLALFEAEGREKLAERTCGEEAQLDQEPAQAGSVVSGWPGGRIAGHGAEDYHRNKCLRSEIIIVIYGSGSRHPMAAAREEA